MILFVLTITKVVTRSSWWLSYLTFSEAKSVSHSSRKVSDGSSMYVTSDETSNHIVDQTEVTPKSSTGNIYLSAQNLGGSGKVFNRSQTPPQYAASSNSSSRRDSIQVPIYSSHARHNRSTNSFKRQHNKYAPVPRTRRLSTNSPIVRRCSLQEDHSLLMFQSQRAKNDKKARRKSLDIIEIREEFRPELDIDPTTPKASMSMISLDVVKLKRQLKKSFGSFRRFPYVAKPPRSSICRSSSIGSIGSKGSKGEWSQVDICRGGFD